MQTWTTVPNKADWGDGPWVDEPDKAQWTDEATGLPCLAVRSPGWGVWCGYVGVHADHPLHGVHYEDDRLLGIDLHASLNYSGPCQGEDCGPMEGRVCHVSNPDQPDDVWWFGFDCAHLFDYCPKMMAGLRDRLPGVEAAAMVDYREVYRTLAFVQEQCAELAKQLTGRDELTPVDWVPLTEGGRRTVPRFRIGAVLDRAKKAERRTAG